MELKDLGNSQNIMLLNVHACGSFTRNFMFHYNPPSSIVVYWESLLY